MTTVTRRSPREERLAALVRDEFAGSKRDQLRIARMFRELQETGLSQREVGYLTGQHIATVNNYLSVLRLPENLQAEIAKGKLPFKLARALARVEGSPKRLSDIAEYVGRYNIRGDRIERFTRMANKHPHLKLPRVHELMVGVPLKPAEDAPRIAKYRRPEPTPRPPQSSREELLQWAGKVEMLKPANDLERLPLVTGLRTLQSRVTAKIMELESA